jgi:hypothetical protein
MDRPLRRVPRNPAAFDYWHEKVALTKLANDLFDGGWEVGLSVDPRRLEDKKPLAGATRHTLDDEFQSRFNEPLVAGQPAFRYNFYKDLPGYFDLAARRNGKWLLVEGKGRSASNRRGAIAQMVGTHFLERRPDRPEIRYAILLPGEDAESDAQADRDEVRRWDQALLNNGGLDWIEVLRIARLTGVVSSDTWQRHRKLRKTT